MLLSYKTGGSSCRRDDSDHIYHLNMPGIDDIHSSRHGAGLTHERHTRGYINANESTRLTFQTFLRAIALLACGSILELKGGQTRIYVTYSLEKGTR